jgi:hypothetical protein
MRTAGPFLATMSFQTETCASHGRDSIFSSCLLSNVVKIIVVRSNPSFSFFFGHFIWIGELAYKWSIPFPDEF